MLDQLMSGGWVMVPLGLASVLALAICVNRFVVLLTNRVLPVSLQKALETGVTNDKLTLAAPDCALRNIATAVWQYRETDVEQATVALTDALINEVHQLERYLTTLGSIASITPLLGLLGTVLGMIDVFYAINLTGARNPEVFSGGIGEALTTTAVGLCIAIPALICHRHFQRRVDEYAQQLEQEGKLLLNLTFPSKRS